jgi:hypothetical protein
MSARTRRARFATRRRPRSRPGTRRRLAACRNNRPVGAPGLQMLRFPGESCRPGALTRRFWELFNRLLTLMPFGNSDSESQRDSIRSSRRMPCRPRRQKSTRPPWPGYFPASAWCEKPRKYWLIYRRTDFRHVEIAGCGTGNVQTDGGKPHCKPMPLLPQFLLFLPPRVSEKHTSLPNLCHTHFVTATNRQRLGTTTGRRTTGRRGFETRSRWSRSLVVSSALRGSNCFSGFCSLRPWCSFVAHALPFRFLWSCGPWPRCSQIPDESSKIQPNQG